MMNTPKEGSCVKIAKQRSELVMEERNSLVAMLILRCFKRTRRQHRFPDRLTSTSNAMENIEAIPAVDIASPVASPPGINAVSLPSVEFILDTLDVVK